MRKEKLVEFELNLTINGDGSSLWSGKASKGAWEVTRGELHGCCIGDEDFPCGIWELRLFGPKTFWSHYTDKLIAKEVPEKLLLLVEEKIENVVKYPCSVSHIGWSEQGMQPNKGWSFDVCLEKEAKDGR